jgi:hypothetical protein
VVHSNANPNNNQMLGSLLDQIKLIPVPIPENDIPKLLNLSEKEIEEFYDAKKKYLRKIKVLHSETLYQKSLPLQFKLICFKGAST